MVNAQTGGTVTPQQQSSGQQSDGFLMALGRCLCYWATVKAFKNDAVSGYQRVISVLFWVCVLHLGAIVLLTVPQLRDPWPWERAAAFLVLNIVGVLACYQRRVNRAPVDTFIDRLVCIAMPLVLLVAIVFLALYTICFFFGLVDYALELLRQLLVLKESPERVTIYETVFHDLLFMGAEIVFYIFLARVLGRVP